MSLLRSVEKNLAGLLFTVALISSVTLFSMIEFTQLDTVKGVVSEILQSQDFQSRIPESDQSLIEELRSACDEDSSTKLVLGEGGLEITCDDIGSFQTNEGLSNFVAQNFVDQVYFQKYNCNLLECIRQNVEPFPLLITQHAHEFYKQMLNYAVLLTVIFGALYVAAAQGIKDRLRSPGFSLLWASLPFLVISFFIDRFAALLAPPEMVSAVKPIADGLLSTTFMIYVYIVAAGIALVAASYVVKTSKAIPVSKPKSKKK